MDIKTYNAIKAVKVTKVYISEYSTPSVYTFNYEGDDKFFNAMKSVYHASSNEVVKVDFIKAHFDEAATLRELMAFFAYELMTKGVARIDTRWHQHSTGFKKDESVVNGVNEPVERLGFDVRSAIEDGIRHFNLEQADAAEQASKEFWAKVEEMKEGKQ
jgi:hypothetical protein